MKLIVSGSAIKVAHIRLICFHAYHSCHKHHHHHHHHLHYHHYHHHCGWLEETKLKMISNSLRLSS